MRNNQNDMDKRQLAKKWTAQRLECVAEEVSDAVEWQHQHHKVPIMAGELYSSTINNDWSWHYAKAQVLQDASVGFDVAAGLTVGIVYEGCLSLELAGRFYQIEARSPRFFCFAHQRPVRLQRYFKTGEKVHKFSLSIAQSWLISMNLTNGVLANRQLVVLPADEELQEAAFRLVNGRDGKSFQKQLRNMGDVLILLAGLKNVPQVSSAQETLEHKTSLEDKLQAWVGALIQSDKILLEDIQIEQMAKSLGSSASGIQRVAKKCYGQSLLHYIRRAKLGKAFKALSKDQKTIGEAAYLAGYKHTSNFSLAFKRAYGITPGEASEKSKMMRGLKASPVDLI